MTFRGFSQSLFLVKNWSCQLGDFKCLEKEFICRNEKTTTTKNSVQFPKHAVCTSLYLLRLYQRFISSIVNMEVILSHLQLIVCRCVAFFNPKKYILKAKWKFSYLYAILYFFKPPSKVECFSTITYKNFQYCQNGSVCPDS